MSNLTSNTIFLLISLIFYGSVVDSEQEINVIAKEDNNEGSNCELQKFTARTNIHSLENLDNANTPRENLINHNEDLSELSYSGLSPTAKHAVGSDYNTCTIKNKCVNFLENNNMQLKKEIVWDNNLVTTKNTFRDEPEIGSGSLDSSFSTMNEEKGEKEKAEVHRMHSVDSNEILPKTTQSYQSMQDTKFKQKDCLIRLKSQNELENFKTTKYDSMESVNVAFFYSYGKI